MPLEVPREDSAAAAVWERLQGFARTLGFSQIGVADIDLHTAEPGLLAWLQAGFQGQMNYMARHGLKRARPAELLPGTVRVISARMPYLPRDTPPDWAARQWQRQAQPGEAVVSIYARGRDYHKVVRPRLQQLADWLSAEAGAHGHRAFTDSAPVLEVELAVRAGLGWRGKHTLLLQREAGSMFFLGELFTTLPLPLTPTSSELQAGHCGTCRACIDVCPTGAIVAPYQLDARRCISYLTIELDGPIPLELRPLIGNRIYGCDDCQLACPWNKFATSCELPDFDARHGLDAANLLQLWAWTEAQFLQRMEGSAIRRIGWQRWRRNLAVSLGNALRAGEAVDEALSKALTAAPDTDPLVREHIEWALAVET